MKKKNIFLVKFTVVAAMMGLFSPSVSIKTNVTSGNGYGAIPMQMTVSLFNTAEARRGGGGTAHRSSTSHRSSGAQRSRSTTQNRNVNRNKNVNRNVNRNKNVNVNVNHHNNRYYGGHRHYGYYHGHALVGFATGLAVGTMISAASMPSTCTAVSVNGINYRRCDNSYYQPFYEGDTVVYKVVNSPY